MKHFTTFLTLGLLVSVLYFVPNAFDNSIWIGLVALVYSIAVIFQVKGETQLVILFSIIFYINLSAFILGPVSRGLLFGAYQYDIWNSQYNTIGMKCILITSVIFYLFFRSKRKREIEQKGKNVVSLSDKQNPFVSIVCLIAVLLICTYSFDGSVSRDEYQSNTSAIYEYVIFIMVLAWYYGGKNTFIKLFWVFCALYYVLMGILSGDRSSAFMLLTLIALYKFRDISIGKILFFTLLGIFAANSVALYREGAFSGGIGLQMYAQGLKSFFSDTAAQSYYSGLTIFYYLDKVGDGVTIFFKWVLSLFTGSLFIDRSAVELSKLAADLNPNGGGGFFQSMFYSFYGYLGVAMGSSIVAYIIKKVFYSWKNTFSLLLAFVIPVMSFRWYLYTPTTFFRACLLNFGIMYLATKAFNTFVHNKKR